MKLRKIRKECTTTKRMVRSRKSKSLDVGNMQTKGLIPREDKTSLAHNVNSYATSLTQ